MSEKEMSRALLKTRKYILYPSLFCYSKLCHQTGVLIVQMETERI